MSSSIPSHVTSVEMSVSFSSNTSLRSSNVSSQLLISTPTSMMPGSVMSGLLNSRNLVQDEKLAVATLATLQSGSASTLIKQDLKWIIQSRRRAEGKSEIEVEFKKPVKDELTSEEVVKRARRRELNRLAARRSRQKGQHRKDKLVEEICHLQTQNRELIHVLGSLSDERDTIIDTLKHHMTECSDYTATRYAATGLSSNVLEKLGFADGDQLANQDIKEPFSATSQLYICTPSETKYLAGCHSPPLQCAKTTKNPNYSSCPTSPVVIGFSGKPLMEDNPHTTNTASTIMHNINSLNSTSPLSSSSTSSFTSSVASPNNSHLGSQISSEMEQRLSSPPHQIASAGCISSHAFEKVDSNQSLKGDPLDYKFTRPASPVDRPQRVLLERSFSFPSAHRETRVDFVPEMCFHPSVDSEKIDPSRRTTGPFMLSKSVSEEQEVPLDLVVRYNKNNDLSEKAPTFLSHKDDRSPGRRRSVDDGFYASYREPLNLSGKCTTSLSYSNLPQDSSKGDS